MSVRNLSRYNSAISKKETLSNNRIISPQLVISGNRYCIPLVIY